MSQLQPPTKVLIVGGVAAVWASLILESAVFAVVDCLLHFVPTLPPALELVSGTCMVIAHVLMIAVAIGMVAVRPWPVNVIQPSALLSVIGGMLGIMHAVMFGRTPVVDLSLLVPIGPLLLRFLLGSPARPPRLKHRLPDPAS